MKHSSFYLLFMIAIIASSCSKKQFDFDGKWTESTTPCNDVTSSTSPAIAPNAASISITGQTIEMSKSEKECSHKLLGSFEHSGQEMRWFDLKPSKEPCSARGRRLFSDSITFQFEVVSPSTLKVWSQDGGLKCGILVRQT